jgi:hypothetical protein
MGFSKLIEDRADKYKQFFSDSTPGQIMVNICPYTFEIDYTPWGLGHRPFSSWDYEVQYKGFMARGVESTRRFVEYTKDLDNDYIPTVSPNMGAGVNSAYFSGAPVIMGDDTSWVHPVIHEWGDLDKLQMDESNPWFCLLKAMVQYCADTCDGSYVPSTFPNYGPGDMANALRGNDLFYDIYDEPENVHILMDKCADATIWLEQELRKIAATAGGGHVSANMWFPNPSTYLSEDFSDLCSAQSFRQFGFKHTQKILDALGGAFIHHHAKGYHIHGEVAKLKGLGALEISLDPNGPKPVEHLDELFDLNGSVPLMIRCAAQDVYQYIDAMKKGRLIIMLNIDSLEEGREVMRFIRKNSKI